MTLTHEKILELVEIISSYSEAEDVDMDVALKRKATRREKSLARSLNEIYCAVHAFRQQTKPGCKHDGWMKNAVEQYKQFQDL